MLKTVRKQIQLEAIIKSLLITTILCLGIGTTVAQTVPSPSFKAQTVMTSGASGNIRAGHLLVRFKATPAQAVLNQLNTSFGARVVGTIPGIGVTHLQAPGSGLALLGHLRKRSDVEFAEFDAPVQAMQSLLPNPPNDTYYSTAYASAKYGNVAQWGPQAVSAPPAWALTSGSPTIVIAIVDTGVDDSHPDLASKIVGEYSYVGRSAKDGFGPELR